LEALAGEAGLLLKLLAIGGIGVLAGRSIWTAYSLKDAKGSPFRRALLTTVFVESEGIPVGTDGSEKTGFSSNSSIEGKACEKPERSSGGEDEGEDVGEGGPKLVGETKVCGEGVMGVGGTTVVVVVFEVNIRLGDVGGVGRLATSRENRFEVPTERPLSCRARTRSAMEPPGLTMGPSSWSTTSLDAV
jgi:hypothetical protein